MKTWTRDNRYGSKWPPGSPEERVYLWLVEYDNLVIGSGAWFYSGADQIPRRAVLNTSVEFTEVVAKLRDD